MDTPVNHKSEIINLKSSLPSAFPGIIGPEAMPYIRVIKTKTIV